MLTTLGLAVESQWTDPVPSSEGFLGWAQHFSRRDAVSQWLLSHPSLSGVLHMELELLCACSARTHSALLWLR